MDVDVKTVIRGTTSVPVVYLPDWKTQYSFPVTCGNKLYFQVRAADGQRSNVGSDQISCDFVNPFTSIDTTMNQNSATFSFTYSGDPKNVSVNIQTRIYPDTFHLYTNF